jgi:hypothetical protein
MKLILLVLSTFFYGMAHGQVSCTASSGTCSLSPGNSQGCQVNVDSKCIVKFNGVCQGVVTNPLAPAGSGYSVFVSAKNLSGGGEDWQTYMGTHMSASGSPNYEKSSYVEDCATLGCTFNGSPVADGASVTAYLNNSVPYGSTCTSQLRTCSNNVLSGSYPFSSCTVQPATNCAAIDGVALNDGQSATFYNQQCVDSSDSCSNYAQTRTCNSGSVSGSYPYSSCTQAAGANCTLDGQTVNHGSSRTFYNATSVPFGGNCSTAAQTRNCNNGVLDGSASYQYASCSVAAGASCTKDGATVVHGASRTFYQAASSNPCTGQSQTCTNGTLSPNTYQFANCNLSCTAGSVGWNTNCSGNRVAKVHGGSDTVSNTASGYTGSATYSCTNGTWGGATSATCGPSSGTWSQTYMENCWDFFMAACSPSNNCGSSTPSGQPCSPVGSSCEHRTTTWMTGYQCL